MTTSVSKASASKVSGLTGTDGLILAGGRSRRFGRDKPLFPVDGLPMIARVHATLAPVVDRVWISVAALRDDLPVDAAQVVDVYVGAGPLAGIHAGLCVSSARRLLVVASDLPHLTAEVLHSLLTADAPSEAPVVGRTPDGRLQPLCALYPKALVGLIDARLAAGQRAMLGLLDACPYVVTVPVPAEPLANLNTRPQESR